MLLLKEPFNCKRHIVLLTISNNNDRIIYNKQKARRGLYCIDLRFKFYVNAKHYVKFGNDCSTIHPYTWELTLYLNL